MCFLILLRTNNNLPTITSKQQSELSLHLGDELCGGAVEVLAAEFEEFYLRHVYRAGNLRGGYVALLRQVQHLILHLLGQPLLGVCPELLVEPLAKLILGKSRQAEQFLNIAIRLYIVVLNKRAEIYACVHHRTEEV